MPAVSVPGERAYRAAALSRILTGRDRSRRNAEQDNDLLVRNTLAGENTRLVSETDRADLASLVLRWMLQRTRWAAQLADARDALTVALAHAQSAAPADTRADELAGCAEVLRALERTLTEDTE